MAGGGSAGKLIAALLSVLAVAGVAIAVALALNSRGASDGRFVDLAETHFAAAMDDAKTISASVESATDAIAPEKAAAGLDAADAAVADGRAELGAAREAISQAGESSGRALYLESLDAAGQAFDALAELVRYARISIGVYADMNEASDLASEADKQLNAAVSAGNRGAYAEMKAKGESARSGFETAATLFDDAQALDSTSELSYSAQYARVRADQAALVMQMAADGAAGRLSDYNDGVAKLQKLDAKAEDVPQPAIVKDPQLTARRIAKLNAAIASAAGEADRRHDEALRALGARK